MRGGNIHNGHFLFGSEVRSRRGTKAVCEALPELVEVGAMAWLELAPELPSTGPSNSGR